MYEDYYEEINPEDFLEEYEVQIRDILQQAISNKYQNMISELQQNTNKINELTQMNKKLTQENYVAETNFASRLNMALKEKEKEVERRLCLGWIVGEKVWSIKSKSNTVVCKKCNGAYKIEAEILGKKTFVNCPHCSYGNVTIYEYFPAEDTITSIRYWVSKETKDRISNAVIKWDVEIWLEKRDGNLKPESLYKTKEECQVACDKANEKQTD